MLRPAFDPELADPCRLAIAIAAATAPDGWIGFVELGRGLGLSEGNLACHVRRLVRAGLIEVRNNGARGRASRTEYALTNAGRARLTAVGGGLETMARVVAAALASLETPGAGASKAPASNPMIRLDATSSQAGAEPETTLVDERFSGPD